MSSWMCQLFCQNVYFLEKHLTTVALLWWQNNRKYEAQSVFCGRGGGGVRKATTSWTTRTLCLQRFPTGPLLPCCLLRMSYFSMCPLVPWAQAGRRTWDRQACLIVIPLLPLLRVRLRDCLLHLWDKISIFSLQNKQTKNVCGLTFCTLVVL